MKISLIGGCKVGGVGGFSTLVDELSSRLQNDISFVIYCEYDGRKIERYNDGKRRIVLIPRRGKLGLLRNRVRAINDSIYVEGVDAIYILGYVSSLFINWRDLRKKKIPLILNPDGLEWKRKKYNLLPRIFLYISERIGISLADFIIADSKEIGAYIRRKYGRESIFIPYGCRINFQYENLGINLEKFGVEALKYYIVVARCVPENHVLEIVKGFISSAVEKKLLIITNISQDKYCKKLLSLCKTDKRILLYGPVYDTKMLYYLRKNAFGYIHGHSVGGTNPSLVEAMGSGNIIIAHRNEFNLEVLSKELGYFFSNQDELKDILEMIEKKRDLEIRRIKIKERAITIYDWNNISLLYLDFFERLRKGVSDGN